MDTTLRNILVRPGYSISAAGDGFIYITGATHWDMDGEINSGGADVFVRKFIFDNPPNGLDSEFTLSTDIYSISAAEAGDLSQALTFNDGSQTLNKYIKTNGAISTNVTSNNSGADIFAVKNENAAMETILYP